MLFLVTIILFAYQIIHEDAVKNLKTTRELFSLYRARFFPQLTNNVLEQYAKLLKQQGNRNYNLEQYEMLKI